MPAPRPTPPLVDAHAEQALCGLFARDPLRFRGKAELSPLLFGAYRSRYVVLRDAAARGELAGDIGSAATALAAAGVTDPASWIADGMLDSEDYIPTALVAHLRSLARRRDLRALAAGLDRMAAQPGAPADDREALDTIAEQVTSLAGRPVNGTPIVSAVADAVAERFAFVWPRRVAFGTLTLLDGDPGLGKSLITMDLAARCSSGAPAPGDDEQANPATWAPLPVLLLNAEDTVAHTIRPRLEAAGADLARVYHFPAGDLPVFPSGLATLRAAMRLVRPGLVVLDPLMALLDASVDAYRDQDVRRVLRALSELAVEFNAAFLVVRHLTKAGSNAKALYRGGGSIGIAGAARSVLLVAKDPSDRTGACVVAHVKSNLGPRASTLRYSIEGTAETAPVMRWHGRVLCEADDLVGAEPVAVTEAVNILTQLLHEGAVAAKVAEQTRREVGITNYAWWEARRRLGVVAEKEGFSRGWVLRLPIAAIGATH